MDVKKLKIVLTSRSIALLMQVALPCAFFAPAPVTLILLGGTDAIMAPPIDYMKLVCVQFNIN
jgi:RNA 3'-terminal phosphate cyclase